MRQTIVALAIALQGCSFVLVSGPPANHAQLPYFDCTSSNVGPILDTVWTVLQTLNLGLAVASDDQGWHDVFCAKGDTSCTPAISRGAAIPLYIGFAAAGAAGMYFGYSRASACRSAKAQLAARAAIGGPAQPGTWPPPVAPAPVAPAPAPGPAPAPAPAPAPPAPAPPAAPTPAPAPAPAPTP
jgi:hypothetical protein